MIYKHCAAPRLKIDFVDALIAAMAERLNINRLLTLDRPDFLLIRPKHCVSFELSVGHRARNHQFSQQFELNGPVRGAE